MTWALVLPAASVTWLCYLPNAKGWLGPDYSMWLPLLLSGADYIRQNGLGSVAWFSPAACGGIPLHADPQGAALSLPQFLSLVLPPVAMLRVCFLAYASAGFFGAYALARRRFGLSQAAALAAAAMFALNSFFGGRFVTGHLTFAPFMLLPLAAFCVIGPPASGQTASGQTAGGQTDGRQPEGRAGSALRCLALGVIIAITLESGMLVLLPPFLWSVLAVLALHVFATGSAWRPALLRLGAGTAWGAALAAAKIVAVLATLSHFPRDGYSLPGYLSLGESGFAVLRALFLGPFPDMTARLANASVLMERPEFEYAVGLAPPVLGLAAWLAWRRRGGVLGARRRVALDLLAVLLLAPVALNTYGAGWTGFLKLVPVLRNSSSLLRWIAADMLPAILLAALAIDFLAGRGGMPALDNGGGGRRWRGPALAGAALALTLPVLIWPGRGYYGPEGAGRYDPTAMQAGWRSLRASGPAPITRIGVFDPARESLSRWILQREDGMIQGDSPLNCYDALFGYHLEAFPRGDLHAGSVFARSGGSLNVKNPACYVFPAANGCRPGDPFAAGAIDQAARFVAYKAFSWRKPIVFSAAEWLGWLAWLVTLITPGAMALRWARTRRQRPA